MKQFVKLSFLTVDSFVILWGINPNKIFIEIFLSWESEEKFFIYSLACGLNWNGGVSIVSFSY